ncbi:MAG: hypothetical protein AB7E80_14935 [Hyphomicrobiaceae bacterium]
MPKSRAASPSSPLEYSDATARNIVRSFNTWAFKREQPSEPELLLGTVAARCSASEPVSFVLYWGKGPRSTAEQPDVACLEFLSAMARRIAANYPPGAHFTLCQTDTHARLNGHSESSITRYFAQIDEAARDFGMDTVRLSALVGRLAGRQARVAPMPESMLAELERCAAKWFRGGDSPREGARRYLALNMIEREAVAAAFPHAIFVTFNGRAYRAMFPATLPVFYMYSLKQGTSTKPWFLDASGRAYESAASSAA